MYTIGILDLKPHAVTKSKAQGFDMLHEGRPAATNAEKLNFHAL